MTDRTNFCPSCKGYADRITALEAENARLRHGLENIRALSEKSFNVTGDGNMAYILEIARASLKAWREVTDQPQE